MTNEYIDTHYSADDYDFRQELVGKSIVQLTEDKLYLNDGTILEIQSGGDCCAWFEGVYRAIDLDDNVIMRVDGVPATTYDDDELFTINIYTAHKVIAAVDVFGNEGTGYYGSSINLAVYRKDTND